MFSAIAKLVLRSRYTKKEQNRKKAFLPWEKVQKVALILCQDASINKSAIDKFIDDTKKFVEVFYIETKSKKPSYGDWICFSKKEKSLLNLPNKKTEENLRNRKYDLVINTCSADNLFSAALLSILEAPLKCTSSVGYSDADLVIRNNEPANVMAGLNNTVHYLKMIKEG